MTSWNLSLISIALLGQSSPSQSHFSVALEQFWPRDETKVYRRHYQRRPEKDMTPEHIAMLIAAPIIVLIILWAPLLDFIGPPCVGFLQRRRNAERSRKATLPAVSAGTVAE
jgi:hypothetical protein